MKLKVLSLAVLFSLSVVGVQGMSVEKGSFKAAGKCGMCETRIEKASMSVKGVESAEWNKETGVVEVKYNPEKTDLDKIQKAVAKAGHDTESRTANDKVYEKLPECCKYERAGATASGCCSDSSSKSACGGK
jgi:copper chaperone CopZ